LRPACVEAEPDDPASIAQAALKLARDEQLWCSLVAACRDLEAPFYDPRHSLSAALDEIVCPSESDYVAP
jgi:hypothetical protein